ncbi:ADP-ribose pyrophosphatase YjhB (NUDIX family) [Kitasatospora sp. GAS204A]|uniref:hypothetical protein n=1 Tax=unclassified Kitasatospora TaxID=2633591 RepID=UPI0024763C78|nr:hypothetical protein [Kitasatospora sp. GAS204B]MDH6118161.1 ADP-ribose pyrophosphatase YjhB (NUDIX family) [Kitasatospora sp. GAS204B]
MTVRLLTVRAVLLHPDDSTVLLLHLTAHPCRQLPGGPADPDVPPHLAARRHVLAQLGLDLRFTATDLAAVDYTASDLQTPETVAFLFTKPLTPAQTALARIPDTAAPTLHGYTWANPPPANPTPCDRAPLHHATLTLARHHSPTAPAYFVAGHPPD